MERTLLSWMFSCSISIPLDQVKDDDLPSTDNEDKVFNPGILIHEKPVKIITRVVQEKKLAISYASLVFEDFDPPFYEPLVFNDVPKSMMLLPFSSENEEKVFKPGIYTFEKKEHSYLGCSSVPFFPLDQLKYGGNLVQLIDLKQALRGRHPMLITLGFVRLSEDCQHGIRGLDNLTWEGSRGTWGCEGVDLVRLRLHCLNAVEKCPLIRLLMQTSNLVSDI
nr:hypothetical protein [Tanacetum cinerariifolium]